MFPQIFCALLPTISPTNITISWSTALSLLQTKIVSGFSSGLCVLHSPKSSIYYSLMTSAAIWTRIAPIGSSHDQLFIDALLGKIGAETPLLLFRIQNWGNRRNTIRRRGRARLLRSLVDKYRYLSTFRKLWVGIYRVYPCPILTKVASFES